MIVPLRTHTREVRIIEKKYRYYGVYGDNGYGVYTSRYCLEESEFYIKRPRIKGYNDFEEAYDYAEDGFLGICDYNFDYDTLPDKENASLNYFYFIKRCKL